MPNIVEDADAPDGVELYDPEDFTTHRRLIEDGAVNAISKEWPRSSRGVRLEVVDVGYDKKKDYNHKSQLEALKHNKFLSNKLMGTFRLVDESTEDVLDEKRVPLMKVPYLTDRGTYIHGGNEYISIAQSRLLPGAYTRIQDNGELETQFNTRPGTGMPFRVAMSPDTAQYKLRMRSSDMHLYSLLHDMGVPDEDLEEKWGTDVFNKNKGKYDVRVLDRAYERMVPAWERTQNTGLSRADKAERLKQSFDRAQVTTKAVKRTLPNLFDFRKSAAWRYGSEYFEKIASLPRESIVELATSINDNHSAHLPMSEDYTKKEITQKIVDFITDNRVSMQGLPELDFSKLAAVKPVEVKKEFELDDDGEEYIPVGVDGLLASTEKILAVNKGIVPPDERDSLRFKKIHRTHNLLNERIRMDGPKIRKYILFQAAKRKNLDGLGNYPFDKYVTDHLLQNPLSSPLEEINPMQLSEAARRITQMGPGGLGSAQSITTDAQAVHPSQFGFISPLEGPECFPENPGTKLFSKKGWVPISKVTLDTELACRIRGRLEFHTPSKVIAEDYDGDLLGVAGARISFQCTPNHNFFGSFDTEGRRGEEVARASYLYGKIFKACCIHLPYEGTIPEGKFHELRRPISDIPEDALEWCVSDRESLLSYLLDESDIEDSHHMSYFAEDKNKASAVERLAISLGRSSSVRPVKNNKGTGYSVDIIKASHVNIGTYSSRWYKKKFEGKVYCVTVPGNLIYFSCDGKPGCWCGNSERAGIDTRMTWGSRIGSNGRLYQKFLDRRSGRMRWMSPEDLDGLTVKLPD